MLNGNDRNACSPSALATAEVAKRHGAKVVALTDSASSPLTKTALHSFYAQPQPVLQSSMCAFMLLAQGLLSALASALGSPQSPHSSIGELISELNSSL